MGDIVVDFRNAMGRALKEVVDQRSFDRHAITLVHVIARVPDRRALTSCLDAWCALYDPAKPPTLRARLEIAKRPGRLLLLKAVELAKGNPRIGLLELVQAVMREAKAPSGPAPVDRSGSKEALYGSRCAELSVDDVTAIQGAVDELVKKRATERDRTAVLVDKVAAEFRCVNARAHKDLWELAEFNPGTPAQQEAFAAVAVGCEAAWRSSSQPLANAYELLDDAFAAFRLYLESEIRTPVDLFRVLAYARAPLTGPEKRWDLVWEELYTEVAWRGLRLAIGRAWNVFQIQNAKGYVGQDAQLVYLPFQRSSRTARGATLLRDRLAMGARSVTGFEEFQQARRRATVTAKHRPGLRLLDEATTRLECARIRQAWKTDPKATRLRQLRVDPAADAFKQAYRINMVVPRMFTVVWADDREGSALVELEGHPGFLFRATRAGVHKLNEEHAYRLLAENAANLTQFLLFYLQVLGFAVDLISAGTAGSLGRVLIRFATDQLEDAAAEKVAKVVVDVLNIKNQGVQMAVELGSGSVPLKGLASAAGRVVDLGDAAKAARGVDVATMGRATQRPETVQSLRPHPSQRALGATPDNEAAALLRATLTHAQWTEPPPGSVRAAKIGAPRLDNGLPPGWDYKTRPNGPPRAWRVGDAVNMPDSKGNHPNWGTIRKRIWKTKATDELARRAAGTSLASQRLLHLDPIESLSPQELRAVVKSGQMPRSVGAEVEHAKIPQRVGRLMVAAGVRPKEARVVTRLGDPSNLDPTIKEWHAVVDEKALDINPSRNRGLAASVDDREVHPLGSASNEQISAIIDAVKRADPKIDLTTGAGKELRDILAAEKKRREGWATWEVP